MSLTWKPSPSAPLWFGKEEKFFYDVAIEHHQQIGPSCVPTTLSMVAHAFGKNISVEQFKQLINTQAPETWSKALESCGLKLAYCNVDQRPLEYYIEELRELNDLFFLSFYSHPLPQHPDEDGKLCTAHIVTMYQGTIFDTAIPNGVFAASRYPRAHLRTKRIFRVVPIDHERGL
jgi:hypothetical protein